MVPKKVKSMIKDAKEIIYIILKDAKQYFYNKKHPKLTYQEYKKKITYKKFEDARRKEIYEKISLTDEQKKQIDDLYVENYGEKVPYTWHRHFSAFTGKFDCNYFPETLYIPEFEYYMNLNSDYGRVLEDKNFLPTFARGIGVKTPRNILSCSKGFYYSGENALTKSEAISYVSKAGKVFIKPTVDSCSGEKCFVAEFNDGIDLISSKTVREIFDDMGSDFCIQEVVVCSDSIRKLYPNGVNTFRVITYRWGNEICVMPVIMRIGQGDSVVDNAHAGGVFIAVDNNGVLHDTAFTEFKEEYKQHPTTGVVFNGYKIENFSDVIHSAKKMHENIPQIGCVNWDFTLDLKESPVLIEANVFGGGIWVIQMAHGCGPFGDKTPEILKWLNIMNKLPQQDYKKYMFGNM